jgi:vancomycin aglycone glucosyltransferase
MRILLSTIGSRGDVQPLVALALEIRALGHHVRLCVPPDFRDWIETLALDVTPIGPEVRTFAASKPGPTGPPTPDERRQMIDATVATQFETIAKAAQDCDAIVGAAALQIAARSIAEQRGIPYVFAAYSPTVLPSAHHPPPPLPPVPGQPSPPPTTDNRELWARNAARFYDSFGAALNRHRAAIGLPAVDDVQSYMFTQGPWLAADPTLAPWPAAGGADPQVCPDQFGAWILPDDRPLAPALERFLDAGAPPIFFGFGSMRAPANIGESMVQAARAVGRRAIVSQGWADLSANVDDDCVVVGEANLRTLFTRVAAIVHHGGAGTTTLAALGGAPQVVVPQMYDQHYWARRIGELGIGAAHAPGMPTAESLTTALDEALRPAVASRARAMAAAVRTDGAHGAAARVIAT